MLVNQGEAPEVFQAQLFALSGVPLERQKIMAKGKALKVKVQFLLALLLIRVVQMDWVHVY